MNHQLRTQQKLNQQTADKTFVLPHIMHLGKTAKLALLCWTLLRNYRKNSQRILLQSG